MKLLIQLPRDALYVYMASIRTRVVFLLDASYKTSWELNSLSLACVRVLLCLAEFPNQKNEVTWNYTFFNCTEPVKKARHFYELRSELLENLIKDIKCTKLGIAALGGKHRPAHVLYRALASVVQDFVWDAPELNSPGKHPTTQGPRNMIFILSGCPHNLNNLHQFCGKTHNMQIQYFKEILQNELIPSDLLLHLQAKTISVFWIDTTCLHNSAQHLEVSIIAVVYALWLY